MKLEGFTLAGNHATTPGGNLSNSGSVWMATVGSQTLTVTDVLSSSLTATVTITATKATGSEEPASADPATSTVKVGTTKTKSRR
jgi:hypothetical protein